MWKLLRTYVLENNINQHNNKLITEVIKYARFNNILIFNTNPN